MIRRNTESGFLAIALFLPFMLVVNLLYLRSHPVPGYVESIYTHVPAFFWILSGVIYCVSAFGLVSSLGHRRRNSAYFAGIILVNNAVILFTPYICGVYLMYGGDLPTHGGMVLDIAVLGRIDFHTNFYPITHLLTYAMSSIAGIDYMVTVRSMSQYFTILLPVFMFLLARYATRDETVGKVTFLLASGFYFCALFQPNTQTTPNALSFLFLPFVIWLLLESRDRRRNFSIALAVTLISVVFFHPLTALVLVGSLTGLFTVAKILKVEQLRTWALFFSCAYGGYVVFLTTMWSRYVKSMADFISGYYVIPGTRSDIGEIISRMGFDTLDLVELFVKMFGHQAVLLSISAAFVVSIVRYGRGKSPDLYKNRRLLAPICVFAVGLTLLIIQLAAPMLLNVSFFRFLMYAVLFAPLLAAAALARFKNHKYGMKSIASIACFLFISSMLAAYPSPYIGQANSQVTYSDLAGSEWILDEGDEIGLSGFFGMDTTIRLESGLMPYSDFIARKPLQFDEKSVAPDHFGYDSNETLWSTFMEMRYLIVTDLDIVSYQGVYASLGRISQEDVDMMCNDSSADLVYDSGGYLVFLVTDSAD